MADIAITASHIWKKYRIFADEKDRLKGFILPWHKGKDVVALEDVNFTFEKGEIIGFVGLNGSGKSTLSQIIAGITHQSEGSIDIQGQVSMLSAGVGLSANLTGRQNIYYKCLLLGFDHKQIQEIEQQIIDFADIGFYIDQPLRTYSSGMRSRVGFAVSVHINPDILIVDEALAVGDSSFMEKCTDRMQQFRKDGKTIIFVSHSTRQMEGFCNRVLWLHKGKMLGLEPTERITKPYNTFAREWNKMSASERASFVPSLKQYQDKTLK